MYRIVSTCTTGNGTGGVQDKAEAIFASDVPSVVSSLVQRVLEIRQAPLMVIEIIEH